MPTEGKPSGAHESPPASPQAKSPDPVDTDRGWSDVPPTAGTKPEPPKLPGFPPPPPLPPARVAEVHGAGSSPRAAAPPTAELPVPTVPVKEPGSSPAAAPAPSPPVPPPPPSARPMPAPPAAPPALPAAPAPSRPLAAAPVSALAATEPHPVLAVTAPTSALAATEPHRSALQPPGAAPATVASPPAFPTPPPLPVAPELPPPLPMSSATPSLDPPLLVSPVAAQPPAPAAALKPPGFFSRLRATRPSGAWLVIGLLVTVLAFGGGLLTGRLLAPATASKSPDVSSEKPEKKGAAERATPTPEPKQGEPAAAAPATPGKPTDGSGTAKRPFNAKLARAAVDRAAAGAKGCRAKGDPAGSVATSVTFATTGKVSNVAITTKRYAKTKTGSCIASRLAEASIPPFSGKASPVKKSITVR